MDHSHGADPAGSRSFVRVPRRARADTHAPVLAGDPRSPAGGCRASPGPGRRRLLVGSARPGVRPGAAEPGPRSAVAWCRARAVLARLAAGTRADPAGRPACADGSGEGRSRGRAHAAQGRATLALARQALAGQTARAALRTG